MSVLELTPTDETFNVEAYARSFVVHIPPSSQEVTGNELEKKVEATTVRQVIDQLNVEHEKFKGRLLDENGNIPRFVIVYVNEEDIRFLQKLDTPVKDGDEVAIVPAIMGG